MKQRRDFSKLPPEINYNQQRPVNQAIRQNINLRCNAIKLRTAISSNSITFNCQKMMHSVKLMSRVKGITILTVVLFGSLDSVRAEPPNWLEACSLGASGHSEKCSAAAIEGLKKNSQTFELSGGWRLAKTRPPSGGAQSVSLIHTADIYRSDFGLAGLTLRCSSDHIDVLLVLLEPQPKHASPQVTITAGSNRADLTSSAVQGGEALLLPEPANRMAASIWQQVPELSVEISANPTAIRGIIPVSGLAQALPLLLASCATTQ